MTKEMEYAAKLTAHIKEVMFNEDCEYYIGEEELKEGSNATHFIHALANIAPNLIYRGITGGERNILSFNHLANQLAFQYSKKEE